MKQEDFNEYELVFLEGLNSEELYIKVLAKGTLKDKPGVNDHIIIDCLFPLKDQFYYSINRVYEYQGLIRISVTSSTRVHAYYMAGTKGAKLHVMYEPTCDTKILSDFHEKDDYGA